MYNVIFQMFDFILITSTYDNLGQFCETFWKKDEQKLCGIYFDTDST